MPLVAPIFRKLLSIGLVAAFLIWVAWYVSANMEAFRPVTQISWRDGIYVVLAFLAIMTANGMFIAVISRAFQIPLSSIEWQSLSFASSFANYFLPLRGGTGIRALYMYRLHGLPITTFVSTLSIMYLMHTVVNSLLALAGMALIASKGGPANIGLMAFFALIVAAGVGAMLIKVDVQRNYVRFPLAQLMSLMRAWRIVCGNRLLVMKVWLLTIAISLASFWQCWAAFDAMSVSISWEGILVYAASKNLTTLIGLTPGGLGIVELTSVYLGTVLGYSTVDALSVQGLIRAVALGTLLLIGPFALLYLRHKISVSPRVPASIADA